jgi:hypothetical protein
MWYEVAFLLCAGSLVAGYLNVVARRWPSDEHNRPPTALSSTTPATSCHRLLPTGARTPHSATHHTPRRAGVNPR